MPALTKLQLAIYLQPGCLHASDKGNCRKVAKLKCARKRTSSRTFSTNRSADRANGKQANEWQ